MIWTPDTPGYWERELVQAIYHGSLRARSAAWRRWVGRLVWVY